MNNCLTSEIETTVANSIFAICGISFTEDVFVVAENSVLRIKICAEKPSHRNPAKPWAQF